MNKMLASFRYWGQRLNAVQALIVGYLVAYPGTPRDLVNALVPEPYRPIAGAIAAFTAFAIVRAASKSDAKKVVANG